MLPVEFKKMPCRPVEFKGQGPRVNLLVLSQQSGAVPGLTQGGAVGAVGRQPEDDEGEGGEEDAGQGEDVRGEDHLTAHLEGEGQHHVRRVVLG